MGRTANLTSSCVSVCPSARKKSSKTERICVKFYKVKITLYKPRRAQRRSRSIAPLILNLGGLVGVGGQHHAPADLPPGKTRYPLQKRLCGPQGRSGRVRKISPPPGSDPRTVQPVQSLWRLSYPGPPCRWLRIS
jgi:hypothetical protein